VRVRTHARCDVHVDAEPIGTSPGDASPGAASWAEFTVEPRALRALIPRCAPRGLFAPSEDR